MRLLARLTTFVATALLYSCVATTTFQGVAAGRLWAEGAFTQPKLRKYVAALYGFDLAHWPSEALESQPEETSPAVTRAQLLAERVQASPGIRARTLAMKQAADDIRTLAQQLSTKTERHEIVKQGFYDLLKQLEQDARASALNEVRHTLEVIRPRQAKDLIISMLKDEELNPEEHVLDSVLQILREMPQDKLKKIFGEFKTDAERQELHRVLVAIGEL